MRDSVSKVAVMLGAVTRTSFIYKEVRFDPPAFVAVSPTIFSRSWCPTGCGGCCGHPWTLDYLPGEAPPWAKPRYTEFIVAGRERPIVFSDLQSERRYEEPCKHLLPMGNPAFPGGCAIHDHNPLSCDMPTIEFQVARKDTGVAWIFNKRFARAHQMKRVDGERGALCQVVQDWSGGPEAARKFCRLKDWAHHFGLTETWLPEIIAWLEAGPHDEVLRLRNPTQHLNAAG